MKEFTVTDNDAGQRFDRFIVKTAQRLPGALLQKYIRKKRIKLNGKGARGDVLLKAGDVLQFYINDEFFEPLRERGAYLRVKNPRLTIVYEDANILLADKKPGVLCHSAEGTALNTLIDNIKAYLHQKGEWDPEQENSFAPSLCNRIDRNTGGIVIAAKNAEALRTMNEKIKNGEVEKIYLCAVIGVPKPSRASLRGYVVKDREKNQVTLSEEARPGAKLAVTEYRTLQTKNGLSLVECRILTGRTHQIRAQMAANGTPILGDRKYGGERCSKGQCAPFQALYSHRVKFNFKIADAEGPLDYLAGASFDVERVDFVEKYFGS